MTDDTPLPPPPPDPLTVAFQDIARNLENIASNTRNLTDKGVISCFSIQATMVPMYHVLGLYGYERHSRIWRG